MILVVFIGLVIGIYIFYLCVVLGGFGGRGIRSECREVVSFVGDLLVENKSRDF